jgi:hypothetical protein
MDVATVCVTSTTLIIGAELLPNQLISRLILGVTMDGKALTVGGLSRLRTVGQEVTSGELSLRTVGEEVTSGDLRTVGEEMEVTSGDLRTVGEEVASGELRTVGEEVTSGGLRIVGEMVVNAVRRLIMTALESSSREKSFC